MRSIKYLTFLLVLFVSCNKQPEITSKDFPFVITNTVSDINTKGATFSAEVLDKGKKVVTDFGFIMESENETFTFSLKHFKDLDDFTYRCDVDIEADTEYSVRAFVVTEEDSVLSNQVSFIGEGSLPPEIITFTPAGGPDSSEVLLLCKHINLQPDKNRVYLHDEPCKVIAVRSDTLVCRTPFMSYSGEAVFKVSNGLFSDSTSTKFNIIGPVTTSFTPLSGKCSERITLKGNNFAVNGDVTVYFDDNPTLYGRATVLNVSDNTIDILVPPYGLTEDKTCTITVKTGLKKVNYDQEFLMYKSWEEKNLSPFYRSETYPAVEYNGNIYVLDINGDNRLIKYTPPEDKWESVPSSEFPGEKLVYSVYTVVGNTLYKAGGRDYSWEVQKELWAYDFISGNWELKNDLPFEFMEGSSFTLDGYTYIITSFSEVWKCDFPNEQYVHLNNFPVTDPGFSFIANSVAYVNADDKTYRYDKQNDSWEAICDVPDFYSYLGIIYNNTGYLFCGDHFIYKFDYVNNKWNRKTTYPGARSPYKITFSINNLMYFFETRNYDGETRKSFVYFE